MTGIEYFAALVSPIVAMFLALFNPFTSFVFDKWAKNIEWPDKFLDGNRETVVAFAQGAQTLSATVPTVGASLVAGLLTVPNATHDSWVLTIFILSVFGCCLRILCLAREGDPAHLASTKMQKLFGKGPRDKTYAQAISFWLFGQNIVISFLITSTFFQWDVVIADLLYQWGLI